MIAKASTAYYRDGPPALAQVRPVAVVVSQNEVILPVEAKFPFALGEARVIGVDLSATERGVLQAPIRLHQESKFRGEIFHWDVEVESVVLAFRALGAEVPRGGPVAAVERLSDPVEAGSTAHST